MRSLETNIDRQTVHQSSPANSRATNLRKFNNIFGKYRPLALGERTALPLQTPKWWVAYCMEGARCPSPRTPPPLSALRASGFGPTSRGLQPFGPKLRPRPRERKNFAPSK